jgi:hypothetical protein
LKFRDGGFQRGNFFSECRVICGEFLCRGEVVTRCDELFVGCDDGVQFRVSPIELFRSRRIGVKRRLSEIELQLGVLGDETLNGREHG